MARFSATPYAKALLDLVADTDPDAIDEVRDELETLAQAFHAVPALGRVMVTPALSQERKEKLLGGILEKAGVRDVLRRFVLVLQRNYRLRYLGAIAAAYAELVDRRLGRVRAVVEVPVPVDGTTEKAIVNSLTEAFGADVVATFSINDSLLAGFRARVGSRVVDGSALGQLERLRRAAAGLE